MTELKKAQRGRHIQALRGRRIPALRGRPILAHRDRLTLALHGLPIRARIDRHLRITGAAVSLAVDDPHLVRARRSQLQLGRPQPLPVQHELQQPLHVLRQRQPRLRKQQQYLLLRLQRTIFLVCECY